MQNTETIQTPAGRIVFVRSEGGRLEGPELAAALGSMDDHDPRWRAFNQLLDEEFAAAALDVTAPVNAGRDHAAGRMAALAELKQRLHTERKKPVPPPKPPGRKGGRKA